MGESPVPKLGQVEVEADAGDAQGSPGGSFGHVDLDVGDAVDMPRDTAPPLSRAFGRGPPDGRANKRVTRRADPASLPPEAIGRGGTSTAPPPSVHDESTRVVAGDVLANITRPPPAAHPTAHEDATSAWIDLDDPASAGASPYPEQPAPSESGVATRGDRVAAMRELYARGDAEGALALAASLDPVIAEASLDHPDASIVVTFGEDEISDPFGGLELVEEPEDELAAKPTAPPPSTRTPAFRAMDAVPPPPSTRTPRPLSSPPASARSLNHHVMAAPPPSTRSPVARAAGSVAPPNVASQLTLTARQSIPRVLKSPAEVAALPIDHRAGFLLAHFDGVQTVEEILDICAMPGDEAIQLITELVAMGVVELE